MAKRNPLEHEFVYVQSDGWEGLYVDGKCVEQYHDVDIVEWLRKYGLNIRREFASNDPQVVTEGTLPKKLSKVQLDESDY